MSSRARIPPGVNASGASTGSARREAGASRVSTGSARREVVTWRRVVIKVGTNLLTANSDTVDEAVLSDLTAQMAALRKSGVEVLLVTSGAVAAGREVLGTSGLAVERKGVASRQVLAAIGQSKLMDMYGDHFRRHGLAVAQALLSRGDLESRLGYLNIRNTLERLLSLGVVPVINENDVVTVEELEDEVFGDNDRLSAMVANSVDADVLVLLGEVEGLFSGDPHIEPDAKLIPEVRDIDDDIVNFAGPSLGGRSRGGMASKVQAAQIATAFGALVIIASGRQKDVLQRLHAGERVGTRFLPAPSPRESRKRWILTGVSSSRGGVTVDAGAVKALKQNGHSLLPAGIIEVTGNFERGDIISITGPDRKVLAWGLANYGATDVARIKGRRSEDRLTLLSNDYGPEVVHRNNMALA
ncbi:MAG: glutamate 5-kinase [Chloroflexi bacterium]|nr:glutamate 5-kinase [Chloroflexota bacterium]